MTLFGEAKEPFLRQLLRLRHRIRSHDTFSRLDPAVPVCFVRHAIARITGPRTLLYCAD
jgi:hypothetical protein